MSYKEYAETIQALVALLNSNNVDAQTKLWANSAIQWATATVFPETIAAEETV
jgi:hypothetical protein